MNSDCQLSNIMRTLKLLLRVYDSILFQKVMIILGIYIYTRVQFPKPVEQKYLSMNGLKNVLESLT